MDRLRQLKWLQGLADDLVGLSDSTDPKEIVEYALSEEGTRSMGIEWPEWFDRFDRSFLEDCVRIGLW